MTEVIIPIICVFAFCLITTIVIECFLAALFFNKQSKREILSVALVQAITNPIAELLIGFLIPYELYISQVTGDMFTAMSILTTIIVEGCVVVAEWSIYKRILQFDRPFIMSLVLNVASYSIGLIVSMFVF